MAQRKKNSDQKWMQSAVKKPDALRDYMKRRFGNEAFTKQGNIKATYLRKVASDKKVSATTRRRANLALTFRKANRSRR